MDGRSRYNKISKLLKPIVGQTIHQDKLWRRIMIDIGTSEDLIRDTMRMMIDLGLIKEVRPFIYKIISSEAEL